jgi:hypothetical protein
MKGSLPSLPANTNMALQLNNLHNYHSPTSSVNSKIMNLPYGAIGFFPKESLANLLTPKINSKIELNMGTYRADPGIDTALF